MEVAEPVVPFPSTLLLNNSSAPEWGDESLRTNFEMELRIKTTLSSWIELRRLLSTFLKT